MRSYQATAGRRHRQSQGGRAFDDAASAYRRLMSGEHLGKIIVEGCRS